MADEIDPAMAALLNNYPEDDSGTMPVVDGVDLMRLASLIRETTAARGVDVWAVEELDLSASAWAELTGRNRSTVARNVRRAGADDE
jgi:hypothetical protein